MTRIGRPRTSQRPSEHTMTVDDWKAFYMVMKLAEQVALHGKKALRSFVRAMIEVERARDEAEG